MLRPEATRGRNISKPRSVRRSAANPSRCGWVLTQARNAASGMGAELSAKAESSQVPKETIVSGSIPREPHPTDSDARVTHARLALAYPEPARLKRQMLEKFQHQPS